MLRRWLTVWVVLFVAGPLAAQVVVAPPPAEYDVDLRYRIRTTRNERVRQFQEMIRALDAAGLVRVPGDPDEIADPNAERLRGRLHSSAVERVLAEPHVRTLLLTPTGAKLPEGMAPIRIELVRGLTPARQQLLAAQTRDRLALLGFVEKVGYDRHGDTLLFGLIPSDILPLLLEDLRWQPSGWLTPQSDPLTLPEPIRSISPLRVVRVIPDQAGFTTTTDAAAPIIHPAQAKLSPDLIAYLATEGAANTRTRLEVIMFDTPDPTALAWRERLTSAASFTFEGIAGQIVTVATNGGAAMEFAALPEVAGVRLPRSASPPVPSGGLVQAADALRLAHLDRLSQLGGTGQGIKLCIVDGDFAGLKRFLGRTLPKSTRLLDLTAETNPRLEPAPLAEDHPGRGTLAALAAVRAAPRAELIMVRVDPTAPHQVLTVARAVAGEAFRTEAMRVRHAELILDNDRLRQSRERLNAERQELIDNFATDEATQKRRIDLQQRIVVQDRDERGYERRLARFSDLEMGLFALRGVSVVANNLSWFDGMPVDGNGPLSAYLDGPARLSDRPRRATPAAWLQAAGDTRGQNWAAPLWDIDNNGVLEFVRPEIPLAPGKWTRELNFLGWLPHDGGPAAELAAGTKLRLAIQWTEPHDATAPIHPLRFRTPLTNLRPVLLRQRDPSGTQTSTDDLQVVARSAELPQLLARAPGWATYEHVIEFTIGTAGRYAVRIEGRAAQSTLPADVPMIPASQQIGEVYPRLSVAVLDAASREAGRPIFIDFRTVAGGMGSPGDARTAVVIGAADAQGRQQSYSAFGSAPALALVARPTLLAPDEFVFGNVTARGTAEANGFAGGTIAAMLSKGAPPSTDLRWLRIRAGGLLVVPEAWLGQLTNTTGLRERAAYLRP